MHHLVFGFVLIVAFSLPTDRAESAAAGLQWEVHVACATGYQANWANRMSIRAPSMSDSIKLQAEDYKAAAVRHYQKEEKASFEEAKQRIEAYIAANVAGFIAKDQAGTLEPFLDSCPEIELEAPN